MNIDFDTMDYLEREKYYRNKKKSERDHFKYNSPVEKYVNAETEFIINQFKSVR